MNVSEYVTVKGFIDAAVSELDSVVSINISGTSFRVETQEEIFELFPINEQGVYPCMFACKGFDFYRDVIIPGEVLLFIYEVRERVVAIEASQN